MAVVVSAAQDVAAGRHGSVTFDRSGPRLVTVRGDTAPRAYENRFHEMLHILAYRSGLNISHNTIRLLSKVYSDDHDLYDRILGTRSA